MRHVTDYACLAVCAWFRQDRLHFRGEECKIQVPRLGGMFAQRLLNHRRVANRRIQRRKILRCGSHVRIVVAQRHRNEVLHLGGREDARVRGDRNAGSRIVETERRQAQTQPRGIEQVEHHAARLASCCACELLGKRRHRRIREVCLDGRFGGGRAQRAIRTGERFEHHGPHQGTVGDTRERRRNSQRARMHGLREQQRVHLGHERSVAAESGTGRQVRDQRQRDGKGVGMFRVQRRGKGRCKWRIVAIGIAQREGSARAVFVDVTGGLTDRRISAAQGFENRSREVATHRVPQRGSGFDRGNPQLGIPSITNDAK